MTIVRSPTPTPWVADAYTTAELSRGARQEKRSRRPPPITKIPQIMRNVPVPIRMGAFDLAVCTDGQQWLVIDHTHRSTIDYVFPERELAIAVAVRIAKARGVDGAQVWVPTENGAFATWPSP